MFLVKESKVVKIYVIQVYISDIILYSTNDKIYKRIDVEDINKFRRYIIKNVVNFMSFYVKQEPFIW